ncbi:MAG TPA: PP2C family serine/threonine-protein phosphatase [Chryseolinea sp.]|nr:PP2C family serine/threonine-protein phosphatase [Chryseolinea sp.]
MSDLRDVVTQLFKSNTINVPANRKELFDRFLQDEVNKATINEIIENQNWLMARWKLEDRIADIIQQPVRMLNGTTGKPYETRFDFENLKWDDITAFQFDGLNEVGLRFDEKTKQITGVPLKSGDIKFSFKFKVKDQPDDAPFNEKLLTLIINPDPKSLWKTIESDKQDPYWKEDNATVFVPLGDRHLLASSKRGRSHANVGSFREDDFAFSELDNGWSIVVVADGAGSAKFSRKGSALACQAVVDYFKSEPSIESMKGFDGLVHDHKTNYNESTQKRVRHFIYNNLGTAAFQAHKQLEEFASQSGMALKDLSSTLIFTLFKKYDIGYALLSFGVGDCPMAVLNKRLSKVILLNWIDVGDFGGGTRFITMPEIFKNEKFASRLGFQLVDDFSYLMLMTDGIYDAKFVVEANLNNVTKWQQFLDDLQGTNDDKIKVVLDPANKDLASQFSKWMDFWSPGNHDDRTLAIVF